MKTRRQILLERHADQTAALDRLRQRVIASLARNERPVDDIPEAAATCIARSENINPLDSVPESLVPGRQVSVLEVVWHELFWDARRTWAGLAAAALAALALNLGAPRPNPTHHITSTAPGVMREAAQERARLMADLFAPSILSRVQQPPSDPIPATGGERSDHFTLHRLRFV